ncbi:site-specific integrase [Pectobacterium sp. CHL-2024]|uniref:site-specific integrase n=1 Tax=Pectobacterium TaxID=122277 RepID=UPI000A5B1227|nr:site-specific integrase [Pectobacterium brasiliense]
MNDLNYQEERVFLKAKQPDYSFCINDEKWRLNRNSLVNVEAVSLLLEPKLIEGYLNTLAFYACRYSPSYVLKINNAMTDFIGKVSPDYIDESAILNYRTSLSKWKMQYLVSLRCFFTKWYSLGYYGIDEKVITLLKATRLKVKEAGDIIRQDNPDKGALTDNEHKALNQAIYSAYRNKKISLHEFSAALLVSFSGRRPLQITSLKLKDIVKERTRNGEMKFLINIPRVKQGLGFREAFRLLNVSKSLFDILSQQASASVALIESQIGRALKSAEKDEVPVFPDRTHCKILVGKEKILDLLVSDRLHASKHIVDIILKRIIKKENVISERTAQPMKMSAHRLRYTIGTRLAREGCSVQVIAELLDHSSIASAGIYIENLPDNAEKISQAVSEKLAFLADVFLGKVEGDRASGNHGLLTKKACSSCVDTSTIPCHSCIYFRPLHDNADNKEVIYE